MSRGTSVVMGLKVVAGNTGSAVRGRGFTLRAWTGAVLASVVIGLDIFVFSSAAL